APVALSMAKAPEALPAVIWYVRTCPASGALAATVPTAVPMALFSLAAKLWLAISGARLGGGLAKPGVAGANSDVSPKGVGGAAVTVQAAGTALGSVTEKSALPLPSVSTVATPR